MGAYDSFIQEVLPYAKSVEQVYGVPTSVTLAQAIHESSGGKRTPNDVYSGQESYNLFGIKGTGDAGSVQSWTTEFINGVKKKVLAGFRAYQNWGGSLNDYGVLLSGERYKAALQESNPYNMVEKIRAAGYATDPNYTKAVWSIMDDYNLTQYDGAGYEKSKPLPSSSGTSGVTPTGIGKDNEKPPNTIFTIPIPGDNDIFITKDMMFTVLLFLIGAILLVLVLYSMFLGTKDSIISTAVKEATA